MGEGGGGEEEGGVEEDGGEGEEEEEGVWDWGVCGDVGGGGWGDDLLV